MRNVPLYLVSLYVVLTMSLAAAANEIPEKPMDPQAMMEVYAKLAQPGKPHKLFATLVGRWTTRTKEWMEPGKPPSESTGSAEMKMLLDGRFLYQEINGKMMGQPFSGIGIDGYDNLRNKYVTAWMDTMGTGIFLMEGTASADGKTITLTGRHPQPGGGYMAHRAIWQIVGPDTQIFEMWGTHHGGQETKILEIRYDRKQ